MHRLNKAVHIVLYIPADYIKYSRFTGSSQCMQCSAKQTHHQYLNVLSYQAANSPISYVVMEMVYQIAIGFTLSPTSSLTTIPSSFSSWAHVTKEPGVPVHTPTLIPESCCPAGEGKQAFVVTSKNYPSICPLALGIFYSDHITFQSSSWVKCLLENFSFLLEEMWSFGSHVF